MTDPLGGYLTQGQITSDVSTVLDLADLLEALDAEGRWGS